MNYSNTTNNSTFNKERSFEKSQRLNERFNEIIPGGSHTYAKSDDQFPEGMTPYIVKGKGCKIWDVDGNEYIEYGMGLRSVTIGHVIDPIVKAIQEQLKYGVNFGRPATIELECAEKLLEMIPNADMVKFAKVQPVSYENERSISDAYSFIELTKPVTADDFKKLEATA